MHSVITEGTHRHTKEQIREEENTVQTTQHRRKSSKMIAYLKFFYNFVQNFY